MAEEVVNSKQLSLTEWFASIKHKDTDALRKEDNSKRERLEVLSKIIPIKFDKPMRFSALEFYNQTEEIKNYIKEHGNESCAFRLVPNNPSLPKLRIRGKSVSESIPWFMEQKIDYSKYDLHVVPHSDQVTFSTIFIINSQGIQGEIIRGLHYELTQGAQKSEIVSFYSNFNKWIFSIDDLEMQEHIKKIVSQLKVADEFVKYKINYLLDGEFANDYLQGYFETVTWPDLGILFIDYNRILHKDVPLFSNIGKKVSGRLSGQIARPGCVRGYVKLVLDDAVISASILEKDILVCKMTSIEYVPLMTKALGIITDLGGILSHAAIVSRELGKPCVVGVGNATQELKDGDFIELNADKGEIIKLN